VENCARALPLTRATAGQFEHRWDTGGAPATKADDRSRAAFQWSVRTWGALYPRHWIKDLMPKFW